MKPAALPPGQGSLMPLHSIGYMVLRWGIWLSGREAVCPAVGQGLAYHRYSGTGTGRTDSVFPCTTGTTVSWIVSLQNDSSLLVHVL